MTAVKNKMKDICILLNSKNEKKIQDGIKKLCLFIKNNCALSDNEYNICVNTLIDNNYLDIIIYVLTAEVEKTKLSKIMRDVNLNYIEIVFYTLSWVLRNKFQQFCRYEQNNKMEKIDIIEKLEKSETLHHMGVFFCEILNFLEVIILNKFCYNRIFILNCIFYLLLFHERFHNLFLTSSLLLNLIKLKEKIQIISDLKRKNELYNIEENIKEFDDFIDDGINDERSEITDDKRESEFEENTNEAMKEEGLLPNKLFIEKEILFCNYSFEKDLVFLYKYLVYKNRNSLSSVSIKSIMQNCDFYSEILIRKKNGKSKIFKEDIIDRKKRKGKKEITKNDFEFLRISILIYLTYCYLFSTKDDNLHKNFFNICNEICDIYYTCCNETLKYYILLCLYEIMKKSETYKNINIFLFLIKLLSTFLNDVQNNINFTLLFFLNNFLRGKKFTSVYKNSTFNNKCIFLLKVSCEEVNEGKAHETKKIVKEGWKKGKQERKEEKALYFLVLNGKNKKTTEGVITNYCSDIVEELRKVQNINYVQVKDFFALEIKKKEIRSICLIFKILEEYIYSCLRETKHLFINHHLNEDNNYTMDDSKNRGYNNEKCIPNKVNDSILSFLTNLKLNYVINHYVIVKTIDKYQHLINMYYSDDKTRTCYYKGRFYLFLFLNLYIELNKIFFIYNFQLIETKKEKAALCNRIASSSLFLFSEKESINDSPNRRGEYEPEHDHVNETGNDCKKNVFSRSQKKRKMKSDEEDVKERVELKRKKTKLEKNNKIIENTLHTLEEEIIVPLDSINRDDAQWENNYNMHEKHNKYHYKYIYKRINSEAMRNTEFLNLWKELINYKILVELYINVKKANIYSYNKSGIINDDNVLIQNMKQANDYLYHFENKINYNQKLQEIIYFFIPIHVTNHVLKYFTKRDKHHYYNYFIISYLYYVFETYKCISLFVLSLDDFIIIPKGVNKTILLKNVKIDLDTTFYNMVYSYYLFDVAYINKYLLNIKTRDVPGDVLNNKKEKQSKRRNQEYEKLNRVHGASSGTESDDYIFNIDVKKKTILNTIHDGKNEEGDILEGLHYFINNVKIDNHNLWAFHFILLKNFINLFDECELKKKLLHELYNKRGIIEIENFTLFININDNIYKVFLKLFIEKCYFTIEGYNLLENLFLIFIYYKKRLIIESGKEDGEVEKVEEEKETKEKKQYGKCEKWVKHERCAKYEQHYNFIESFLFRILKKTNHFDASHFDDLLIFFKFLRSITSLREFVVALSVFYRFFNIYKTMLTYLDNFNDAERTRKEGQNAVAAEKRRGGRGKKRSMFNCENSLFFNLIIDFFFSNNQNFVLNGIPMLKIIKDSREGKISKNSLNNVFDYTVKDIVRVYLNYVNYIKCVLLHNPYIYLNFNKKLRNKKTVEELFYSFTRRKGFTQYEVSSNLEATEKAAVINTTGNIILNKQGIKLNPMTNANNGHSSYKNEIEEHGAVYNKFLKFQENVKLFLKEIKNVQRNRKSSHEYLSKVEKICKKKSKKLMKKNFIKNKKGCILMHNEGAEYDRPFGKILNNCKNMLSIYLNDHFILNVARGNAEESEVAWQVSHEEDVFYNLSNLTNILFNYYFVIYTYVNKNDNVHMDTLLLLIYNINEILKVYINRCENISTNYCSLIKRYRNYDDIEHFLRLKNEEQDEETFYSNKYFVKVNKLNRRTFLLFIKIFKKGLFKKLLELLLNICDMNVGAFYDFVNLNLCFLCKNVYFFRLKKEKYIKLVSTNLTYLMNIILQQEDTSKNNKHFIRKTCFMILFLLKKIERKESFINKLIKCYYYDDKAEILRIGGNSTYSRENNKKNSLLEHISNFFIRYMANESMQKSLGSICDKSTCDTITVLINIIMKNKYVDVEMRNISNALCKLYRRTIYKEDSVSVNYDIIKKIMLHDLSMKNDKKGTSCIFKRIKNDRIYMLNYKDIDRERDVFIMYNYVKSSNINTLKKKNIHSISKENYIIMAFLYLMNDKYRPPGFDDQYNHFIDNVTYEKMYYLQKKKYPSIMAEKYINRIIYAYENVKEKRMISFLLLNTKKLKNKNCLFIALSILFFLGNVLGKKKKRTLLFKQYNKYMVRRMCKIIFFYFYGYFFKNDIKRDEHIFKSYERIVYFTCKILLKDFKKSEQEEEKVKEEVKEVEVEEKSQFNNKACKKNEREILPNSEMGKGSCVKLSSLYREQINQNYNLQNGYDEKNRYRSADTGKRASTYDKVSEEVHVSSNRYLKYNKSFINGTLKRRSDYDFMLVLLINLLNKNKGKFNIEKLIDKYIYSLLIHISFFPKEKRKVFYYENVMRKYIYMFSEEEDNSLEKRKRTYILFYSYFLLFKYMKLRNLDVLNMINVFFKDVYIEKLILAQIEKYKKVKESPKKKKKSEKMLIIFLLKLIKMFYEEWYRICKDKGASQDIYLKTLNKNLFHELKNMYNYTLTCTDIHIRNIFFVDLSYYLKSVTMDNILNNNLIDEVLKFKEFNLNYDNNYNWLYMNPRMLSKTCLYFYMNEDVRKKFENREFDFLSYFNMNSSGEKECCTGGRMKKSVYNYENNGLSSGFNESRNGSNDRSNYYCNNIAQESSHEFYNKEDDMYDYYENKVELMEKGIFLKDCSGKNPYCILNQNEFTKKETFYLAHKIKLKDNMYDYIFLLCMIVSKLIFCFILMSEKLRVFFYHFRILYTTYYRENIFLNYDLLKMQEINRKIKNYIKRYPDIHFYIDYENNNKEEEEQQQYNKMASVQSYYDKFYHKNGNIVDDGYNNVNVNEFSGTRNGIFGNDKNLISYDDEKEHFYHLKKNQKNSESCKFCIKFKQIHNISNSERVLNLFSKDEKDHIKNMIYYGKTIRTYLFLHSPYEDNIYKNCNTFINVENILHDKEKTDMNCSTTALGHVATNDEVNNNNKCNSNSKRNMNVMDLINTYCIVDSSDLLYGRKMKENHFKKNYKKVLNKYLLNDIDFFGKWLKPFSLNALKILIFCLSSNDLIVRIISLKGLSIFYQLLENSFFLYKIRKKILSFKKRGVILEEKGSNILCKNKRDRKLLIPFKEMFYLYFFMKKLKLSVDPHSYSINSFVSSYSFFLINGIFQKMDLVDTLKSLIRNKTFSVYFIQEYLNRQFRKSKYISSNIINFFIMSNQALYSSRYDLKKGDIEKEEDVENDGGGESEGASGAQNRMENGIENVEEYPNDNMYSSKSKSQRYYYEKNNYLKEDSYNNKEVYVERKNKTIYIDRSFYATSNINSRITMRDFGMADNEIGENVYQEKTIIKKKDRDRGNNNSNNNNNNNNKEVMDKFYYIQINHKNAIKNMYNVLNNSSIFEIYLSLFFNNYLNYYLLKKFLILLITSSSVLCIEYMKLECAEGETPLFRSNEGDGNNYKNGFIKYENNKNHCSDHVSTEEKGWRNTNENSSVQLYLYKEKDVADYYNNRGNINKTNRSNCNVNYYIKKNLVLKLITQNNILLWLDSMMHQKLFKEEIAFHFPSSFMFPLLNFYDLMNENEKYYMNIINREIVLLEESGAPITFHMKRDLIPISNYRFFGGNGEAEYKKENVPSNIENISTKTTSNDVTANRVEKVGNIFIHEKNCTGKEVKTKNGKITEKESSTRIRNIDSRIISRMSGSMDNITFRNRGNDMNSRDLLYSLSHMENMVRNRYIMGYIFKESYDKTSDVFFCLSLFINNIVSNLFYPSISYYHIFTNMVLNQEKKRIKRFILSNAYNIICKNKKDNNKFDIWNFWFNNFHKSISCKIRNILFINKVDGSLRGNNLNIFYDLMKIIRYLCRSLYYIFINLFHKEYFYLFIYYNNKKKYLNKEDIACLKNTNKNNVHICKTFLKYVYLLFNIVFNICTCLYDQGISKNNLFNNLISTNVSVDLHFVNDDISLIMNEVMIFFENVVILYNYFNTCNSKRLKRDRTQYDRNRLISGEEAQYGKVEGKEHKGVDENGGQINGGENNGEVNGADDENSKKIEMYYMDIHKKLLKETYNKSPHFSNYYLYRKIILCVLCLIHTKCYKKSKYFYYIFLNKLITIYHFLEEGSRPKVYLYIYELFSIIRRNTLQSLLKQII
ncbi:conserved Plasmodium protein, unknown function [Plasmodium malariae]|uniref:Uncharacterized protein n=1 Tax=Plasmodium malariae TaxID=5858 RepID=A0A1D3JK18_PLAMA|nr:conserved Plasmodium protein, unknown function [Plasmodium malariae]SBT86865.1 conserved Plasmodium protein, unknown function [Plasmodium malariae]